MAPRALLVADASAAAGLGHLARCTALACALREKGFEVETLGLGAGEAPELDGVRWEPWQPNEAATGAAPALLVLDTYDRAAWQGVAALEHGLLAAFEDALPSPSAADVVIAPQGASDAAGRVLAGLRFACLRRPFWEIEPRRIQDSPQRASRVLITTGGGDLGGLAGRIATGLREHLPALSLELVWGPGFGGEPPEGVELLERPTSLLESLLRADAVVCTGGQTMLEAAATGAPALVLEGAPNQRPQIAGLAALGAVLAVSEENVPAELERLLGSSSLRRRLSRRAQEAVDGHGALRIATELVALEER
jgi:spore coat polysaccharide biosynthesis predicted glycosyltransferase SpsG